MEYILENSEARVVISTKAAEIHSFVAKDNGIEMMWNGNPEYWAGRNPILFPQVGNTYNKTQVFKGKEYHMGNHGLAIKLMKAPCLYIHTILNYRLDIN